MPQHKPTTIVVVDDEQIIRYGLRLALKNAPNLEVVGEAKDGLSGIQAVLEHEPDVVLMDIGMPIMDGIEATKQIKSKLAPTKVVMLTSHGTGEDVFAAFSAGADAYCLKDISSKNLIYAITNIVEGIAWLDPEIAACVLIACKADQSGPESSRKLSALEFEVLSSIVEGHDAEAILERLKINQATLVKMMPQIMKKLAISEHGIYAE